MASARAFLFRLTTCVWQLRWYVFMTCGFYDQTNSKKLGPRERLVKRQLCPDKKPADMSDAEYEEKRNELGFVLGVSAAAII